MGTEGGYIARWQNGRVVYGAGLWRQPARAWVGTPRLSVFCPGSTIGPCTSPRIKRRECLPCRSNSRPQDAEALSRPTTRNRQGSRIKLAARAQAADDGDEPATSCLRSRCSITKLHRRTAVTLIISALLRLCWTKRKQEARSEEQDAPQHELNKGGRHLSA